MKLEDSQQNKRLLWLGAGHAVEPVYDFDEYENVILIEAREDACTVLREKLKSKRVNILNRLIYVGKRPSFLNVFNISDYSSTREPTVLKKWFPSLSLVAKQPVDSLSVEELMRSIDADFSTTKNELVIDTPDIAYEFIEELDKLNAIKNFGTLTIVHPVEGIYEGMKSIENIESLMDKLSYDMVDVTSCNPDTKIFKFKFNVYKNLSNELEKEKKHLEEHLADMSAQLSSEIEKERLRADNIQKASALKIEDLETKYIELKKQSEKRIQAIEAKTRQQVSSSATQIESLKNKIKEADNNSASLKKELERNREKANGQLAEQEAKALSEAEDYRKKILLYEANIEEVESQNKKVKESLESSLAECKGLVDALERDKSGLEKKLNQTQKNYNKLAKQSLEQGNSLESFIHQCSMFFYGKAITYIDIGAFDGKVAKSFFESDIRIAEAILVEPNPKSCKLLNETLESSTKLPKKLNIQNIGVSSAKGPLRLYDNNSMSRIISTSSDELPDSVFEISVMTLSEVCSFCSESQISLLKIDVEGHEIEVLESGAEMFANQKVDIIYIEAGLNPEGQQQVHYKLLDDFFLKYNYRLFRVFEQQYEWLEDSPFLRRWNMAYMSSKFADKHPYKLVKELFELKRSKE
ncbi:MAG: FkbM family methyltransferase [Gammaproteobacteria bacterium]|nr:FkbM family methyltransferase [Gammaproteobacteria bacterium]